MIDESNTILLPFLNMDKKSEKVKSSAEMNFKITSSHDFPKIDDIREFWNTLFGNSLIKKGKPYKITGIPIIVDDKGLGVDLLNGAPVAHSVIYAGKNVKYDNIAKLLLELAKYQIENIKASKFKTAISCIGFEMELTEFGEVEGYIITYRLGFNDFEYDSIFRQKGLNLTFAEMS